MKLLNETNKLIYLVNDFNTLGILRFALLISANIFFIILDNLYDLLWSTSRP